MPATTSKIAPKTTNGYRPRNGPRDGGRNGYGQTRHGAKGSRSSETDVVRKLVTDLGRSINALSKRLDNIENRGPDRKRDGQTKATAKKAGPPSTERSNNDDFAAVSKSLYRIVQVRHHESNWEQLPKSIEQRLSKLASDIKPPVPDSYLQSALQAATTAYGKTIADIVRQHLERKRHELEAAAAKLNPVDVDRARTIAGKYLSTRLGKRLDDERRATMLDDAVAKIGSGHRPAAGALVQGGSDTRAETEFQPAPARRRPAQRTTVETPAERKRKAESTPPTAVQNRFEIFAEMERIEVLSDNEDDIEPEVEIERQPARPAAPKPTPKKARTSTDSFRTRAGVHVYCGDKDQWTAAPEMATKTMVIGDSNMRDAPEVPDEWEIHSMPGAKLEHVTRLVRRMKENLTDDHSLCHVIIQVGINHRSHLSTVVCRYEMTNIMEELDDVGIRSSFCGISIPSKRPKAEVDRIREINEMARNQWPYGRYIEPLTDKQIAIKASDVMFRIHHTPETIGAVVDKMVAHDRLVF